MKRFGSASRFNLRTACLSFLILALMGGNLSALAATTESSATMSVKTRSTFYTPQKIAAARNNIVKYEWAKSMKDSAVQSADKVIALGYERLWNIVPPQSLPRSYDVNQELGSPVNGRAIYDFGEYAYTADPVNQPWKIFDPTAGEYTFPTNDFGAYYTSGLNKQGIFDPALADRSLLVNTLYPEKGPTWGVDDGYGWVDEKGDRYTFIAYYIHWYLWYGHGFIQNALENLTDAYIYTGDLKYARAGVILLDRVADIYPSLDIAAYDPSKYLNSHELTGQGKAVGAVWETFLDKYFIKAYDAFFPAIGDPEIVKFLSQKAEQFGLPDKSTADGIKLNIENGILRETYKAVKKVQVFGNSGFHQSSLALAAVVLDSLPETKEWLDFDFQHGGLEEEPIRLTDGTILFPETKEWLYYNFQHGNPPIRLTGGNILPNLVNTVDRDGQGNEGSIEYNNYWITYYLDTADILDGYDKYTTTDLYNNVKFRKMFTAQYPLMLSENFMPAIGDGSQTGKPGIPLDKGLMIKAFEKYHDPIFAQVGYFLNHNSVSGIHGDVFSPEPEQVAKDIRSVITNVGPLDLKSTNMTGFGFTALRDGKNIRGDFGITDSFSQMRIVEASTATKFFAGSGTLQFQSLQDGDHITFAFNVPKADDYEFNISTFKAPTYGKYNVLVDGKKLKEYDFYGTGNVVGPESFFTIPLTAGDHQITFEGAGQNVLSTGFKMGLIQFILLNTEDRNNKANTVISNTLRDAWMYYGSNNGYHAHADTLNLGLHAYGLDLLPDLGYPEFADASPGTVQWVTNTVSHNTVIVDKGRQQKQIVAQPKHYDDGKLVKLIDVEAPQVYPQTKLYKRTTAMIKVDDKNSYTVDLFRVKGGNDHHFSFHAAEGTVKTEGLKLTAQTGGTYAGADVNYGVRPEGDSVPTPQYTGPGFHYLEHVEKDTNPGSQFSVDWDIVDTYSINKEDKDVHLRLTMLGDLNDVALADGIPPQNRPGNPQSLKYVIAHRTGTNLDSLFTSVIEPYESQRYIASIAPAVVKLNGAKVTGNDVKAIKVELKNGRVDYIVSALNPELSYSVAGKFQFKGSFGVFSEMDGKPINVYINDGTYIGKDESLSIDAEQRQVEGTVIEFTKEMAVENTITVKMKLKDAPEKLVGIQIYIQTDGVQNGVYLIKNITSLGNDRYKLDIGDTTLIRSYLDSTNINGGFIYNIAEGAAFRIPLAKEILTPIKPFSITKSALTHSQGGVQAAVTVKNRLAYKGNVVVLFQLMHGSTPISTIDKTEEINDSLEVKADFKTKGSEFSVKVFVLDSFNKDTNTKGSNLAEPVLLQFKDQEKLNDAEQQ